MKETRFLLGSDEGVVGIRVERSPSGDLVLRSRVPITTLILTPDVVRTLAAALITPEPSPMLGVVRTII